MDVQASRALPGCAYEHKRRPVKGMGQVDGGGLGLEGWGEGDRLPARIHQLLTSQIDRAVQQGALCLPQHSGFRALVTPRAWASCQ